jgi:hypothetical protein
MLSSSGSTSTPSQLGLLLTGYLLGLLFDPEYGGSTFLRNIGELLPHYAPSHLRRRYSSQLCLLPPEAQTQLTLCIRVYGGDYEKPWSSGL